MILLTIIAVGLLTLSSISMRGNSQEQARMEAQANARLALAVAIGELQKQIGPDQRITANGDIIPIAGTPAKNPHWMGVWNSWKAGDGTSFHRSVEGESLMGMAPTYLPGRNDYFRSWLVSLLNPANALNVLTARDFTLTGEHMPDQDATAVQLVGKGSLGDSSADTDYVSAQLIDVEPNASSAYAGRYGWWVGDESQKARVMDDSYLTESSLTLAQKISRAQAPGSTGTKTIEGLENITNVGDAKLQALASMNTLDLVPGVVGRPSENFHHVSSWPDFRGPPHIQRTD